MRISQGDGINLNMDIYDVLALRAKGLMTGEQKRIFCRLNKLSDGE